MLGLTKLVSMLGLTKPCLQVMSTPEQRRSRRWFPLSGETKEDKGWIQLLKNYFLIKKNFSIFYFFFCFLDQDPDLRVMLELDSLPS